MKQSFVKGKKQFRVSAWSHKQKKRQRPEICRAQLLDVEKIDL